MPVSGIAFRAPEQGLGGFGAANLGRLASASGDIALIMTADGRIVDASFASVDPTGVGQDGWIGRNWADLASMDSQPKIAEMLAAAHSDAVPRWRQINHPSNDGDVPVRYLAVGSGSDGNIVAVGQDMRSQAALQQRLIQAQQSLERDYLKLRQAETRYRMLFDLDSEAVMIVEADTRRIREANPAAATLAKAKPGALVNRALTSLIDPSDHEALFAYLGRATASDTAEPVQLRLAGGKAGIGISATAFRQDRTAFYLIRFLTKSGGDGADVQPMRDLIERLPDGFVLTDAKLSILSVNTAFVDMTGEASAARLKGAPLGDYVGRAGIDVDLIIDQVREHGNVRNIATILRGRGGNVEEVELSAVAAPTIEGDGYGFSIRSIARRARDLPPQPKDMPRSVEQLTELVGRMSLKDIVRESTDLIERLCIEAALEYTSDNRASAAEILGVSRQSLYSKLHRHGLGNLVGEED
jgi:transcriptional regulator PpsR